MFGGRSPGRARQVSERKGSKNEGGAKESKYGVPRS